MFEEQTVPTRGPVHEAISKCRPVGGFRRGRLCGVPPHWTRSLAAAGVGNATLCRHFPTRQALIAAVYDDRLRRVRAAAEETCTSQPAFKALMT
ncbi:TetR/AcrR family transcriptional regulator [Streptomyces sp. CNQ-509]|uniref:TetR/AcrR family transcriptional regulator n=1 Tax=Streptomyces sp. CNQ-509 TaxID=444103 RepID=UPI0013DE1842|nr:TetR/AcrR family transcriptional regulator [Streptomyces sp. CNQ-509]